MLSLLQQRVATLLTGLSEAEHFVLAGGGALIVHGIVDRQTRDLDFFSTNPDEVAKLLPVLEHALLEAGLDVTREQIAPGFARLIVTDQANEQQTRVDLAADARLLPPDSSEYGHLLSAHELAIDKVLAVFGRAEARDFIDLAALEQTFDLPSLCELAQQKDLGFQADIFCQMLTRFDRLDRDEFDISDNAYNQLKQSITRWTELLA